MPEDELPKDQDGAQYIAKLVSDMRASFVENASKQYDVMIAPFLDIIHALTQRVARAEDHLQKS